jgi:tetratricopeptide (TPR) repeat protein
MPHDLVLLHPDIAKVQHEAAEFGTGRLIAKNLILTSAHVLKAKDGSGPFLDGWEVRLTKDRSNGRWPFRRCNHREGRCNHVVWHDQKLDLALIQLINPEGGPLSPKLRLRVATISTNDRHDVEARGYPRASKRVDGYYALTPVRGRLAAADDDQPLEFGVNPSDLPNNPPQDWPGMSGAAVLLQDTPDPNEIWIYGVIQGVPPNFHRKLSVKRLAKAWEDQSFRELLVSAGAPDNDPEDPSQLIRRPAAKRAQIFGGIPDRIGIAHFTGRQAELEQLDDILTGGRRAAGAQATRGAAAQVRRAAVHGMGGLGKTSLAWEYVQRNRDYYSGVWWCSAATRTQLQESLAALGARLNITAPGKMPLERVAKETLRHLSEQRENFLLVYDSVPNPDEVKGLLPAGATSVLITSRFLDWRGLAEVVKLPLLPEAEAIKLLEQRSGRHDPVGARTLSVTLGYFPLALSLAAAHCIEHLMSFVDYASKAEALIAGESPRGEFYEASVATTFKLAIEAVTARCRAAATLMAYLAYCAPERIPLRLVDGAIENETERNKALTALAKESLVEYDPFEDDAPAVTVHRLVQTVARAEASRSDTFLARRNVIFQLLKIYPNDAPTNPTSWPLCARLTPHLLASRPYFLKLELFGPHPLAALAIRAADYFKLRGIAAQGPLAALASRAGDYFQARGIASQAVPFYRTALELCEDIYGPVHVNTARSLGRLASVLEAEGDFAGARPLLEQALAIDEAGADQEATSVSLNNLAHLLWRQHDFDGARPRFERALTMIESIRGPDDPKTALALLNLASVLRDSGKLAEARPLFERSRAIQERISPLDPATATSLEGFARFFEVQGNLPEARSLYEQALTIREKAYGSDHPDTAYSARCLAVVLHIQGNLAEARPLYERALAAYEKTLGSDHWDTNKTRYGFALLLLRTGFPAEALSAAQAALGALENALGSKTSSTKEAARVTCAALDALGRTDEAKSLRLRYELGSS